MSVPFSEDLWQRLSGLWRRDKKEEEEAVGYDDPQLKQMLDVMMVSRRSMKAAEKQKYDIDRAWRRVEKQTAGGWRVPGWCRYAAAVTVLFFSVWGWVTYNRESALPVTGELTDVILPGVSKAELILASGERIILGTQTEIRDIEELGVKITNDTSGGELKYETGSTEDSTITAYNTLIVPKGGEYMVRLPDGSQVWLNSETTIRFPVRFAAGKREVQLCGEAFFKVCRDTTAPFQVSTENGEITVLGTSFNVSTYREDNYWQTTQDCGTRPYGCFKAFGTIYCGPLFRPKESGFGRCGFIYFLGRWKVLFQGLHFRRDCQKIRTLVRFYDGLSGRRGKTNAFYGFHQQA